MTRAAGSARPISTSAAVIMISDTQVTTCAWRWKGAVGIRVRSPGRARADGRALRLGPRDLQEPPQHGRSQGCGEDQAALRLAGGLYGVRVRGRTQTRGPVGARAQFFPRDQSRRGV